ncbi:Na+/melibiose symporter-like transporter [Natranaerovirga pectinivora]|uniref:Na+/melibiose symporter-like transporter n=1 Tax=Natranaerovirga pectinivora TaxID=682400 RepID=A0A4R3MP57_9FIRM|nr:MFS transporter [Natranaerovirga pectinivora]TCT17077.1 Na+/melibiose symporter-like transporter [Natranaerovirga pectinivora]
MKDIKYSTKIGFFDKLSYGIGNLGFGVAMQCLASFLMFYSTVILGVPGRYVGFIVALSVFWDAVTDPVIGYLSDNTKFKRGRRHFYLFWGTITIAFFNYFMWTINPSYSMEIKVVFLFLLIFVLKTVMTVYGTPYTALGAELSYDYDTRTAIQGYRIFFFLMGLAFPTVVGITWFFRSTYEFPIGQMNPVGYELMGITISIIVLVSGFICYFVTKKYIPNLPKAKSEMEKSKNILKDIFIMFSEALKNRYFSKIFWGYLFVNICAALIGTLGLHVFTYTFIMDNNQIGIVMGIFFLMSLLSQPFWTKYSAKNDKQPSMEKSILISLIGCIFLTGLVIFKHIVRTHFWLLIPILGVVGFGAGGLFLFPPAMVGDVIDVEEYETGKRSEGIYFGTMTFGYKASQAIAIFLVGISLDVIGFNAEIEIQSYYTSLMLGLILCIGSIIVLIIALFIYRKYTLNKDKVLNIQSEIIDTEIVN